MAKLCDRLMRDKEAQEIVRRASLADWRDGRGGGIRFALFVVNETRKVERKKRKESR